MYLNIFNMLLVVSGWYCTFVLNNVSKLIFQIIFDRQRAMTALKKSKSYSKWEKKCEICAEVFFFQIGTLGHQEWLCTELQEEGKLSRLKIACPKTKLQLRCIHIKNIKTSFIAMLVTSCIKDTCSNLSLSN